MTSPSAWVNRVTTGGAFMLLLLGHALPARAAEGYTEEVTKGLALLRGGDPPGAAKALLRAIRLDANDPAAWTAFGAVLLDTSNVNAARRCFQRGAKLNPVSAQPAVGLALCDIVSGNTTAGASRLETASAGGCASAATLHAYLAALTQAQPPPASDDTTSPLSSAIRAFTATREGLDADWKAALPPRPSLSPPHWPLTASFDPARPVLLRWQANPRVPMPPAQPRQTASGDIILNAPSPTEIAQATYDVDGSAAGITNVAPFSWTWKTSQWPDGWHLVRTAVVFPSGRTASSERWVITANVPGRPRRPYPEAARLDAMLNAALSIQPDARFARLALAKRALALGQHAEARSQLEAIVGEDPLYRDAAHLLRTLPKMSGPDEIWRGSRTAKRIALTFDDGPNWVHTPKLLDALDALHVPATFMVVGKQAAQYPDIVRRMASSGYEVENHTWNHRNMRRLSEPEALRELASTKTLITLLTGRPVRFYRPPGGNIGETARRAARALGLSAAMWTFASGRTEGMPLEDMLPPYLNAAKPGAIYLIHNGTDKIEALLPLMVKTLHARGWQFVRLDELIAPLEPASPTAH